MPRNTARVCSPLSCQFSCQRRLERGEQDLEPSLGPVTSGGTELGVQGGNTENLRNQLYEY